MLQGGAVQDPGQKQLKHFQKYNTRYLKWTLWKQEPTL